MAALTKEQRKLAVCAMLPDDCLWLLSYWTRLDPAAFDLGIAALAHHRFRQLGDGGTVATPEGPPDPV